MSCRPTSRLQVMNVGHGCHKLLANKVINVFKEQPIILQAYYLRWWIRGHFIYASQNSYHVKKIRGSTLKLKEQCSCNYNLLKCNNPSHELYPQFLRELTVNFNNLHADIQWLQSCNADKYKIGPHNVFHGYGLSIHLTQVQYTTYKFHCIDLHMRWTHFICKKFHVLHRSSSAQVCQYTPGVHYTHDSKSDFNGAKRTLSQ